MAGSEATLGTDIDQEYMQIDQSGGMSDIFNQPRNAGDLDPANQHDAGQSSKSSGPVYVSLHEVKETLGKTLKKGGTGFTYSIKFYLVDSTGKLHHCVTGVDTGDSHYTYSAEDGWPGLFCHNRAEVKAWAERQMASSQARAGFHSDVVQDIVPLDGSSPQLPTFVSYREEKEDLRDGRHVIRWYLIDNEGHGHLAVTGEEKDTKDGHYHYHTETVFNIAAPLQAGNQEAVHMWLEQMIVHPGVAPGLGGGKALHGAAGIHFPSSAGHHPLAHHQKHGSAAARGGGRTGSAARSRGGRPPPGPSSRGKNKQRSGGSGRGRNYNDMLLRHATTNAARRGRGPVGWRVDPEKDARDVVAAELRRWAHDEAVSREKAKSAALHYVGAGVNNNGSGRLEEREKELLQRVLPAITAAAKKPNSISSSRTALGSAAQQTALLSVISALRDLSHAYAPLALIAHSGLKEALQTLKNHSHPDVSHLASVILDQWLRSIIMHTLTLSDPKYVSDPRIELDEGLFADPVRFDAVVTAATSRQLQPLLSGDDHGHTPALEGGGGLGIAGYGGGASGSRRTAERRALDVDAHYQGAAGEHLGRPQQQQQQPQQRQASGRFATRRSMDLEPTPSAALVNAPVQDEGDDGAKILPEFEQKLAADGVQF